MICYAYLRLVVVISFSSQQIIWTVVFTIDKLPSVLPLKIHYKKKVAVFWTIIICCWKLVYKASNGEKVDIKSKWSFNHFIVNVYKKSIAGLMCELLVPFTAISSKIIVKCFAKLPHLQNMFLYYWHFLVWWSYASPDMCWNRAYPCYYSYLTRSSNNLCPKYYI